MRSSFDGWVYWTSFRIQYYFSRFIKISIALRPYLVQILVLSTNSMIKFVEICSLEVLSVQIKVTVLLSIKDTGNESSDDTKAYSHTQRGKRSSDLQASLGQKISVQVQKLTSRIFRCYFEIVACIVKGYDDCTPNPTQQAWNSMQIVNSTCVIKPNAGKKLWSKFVESKSTDHSSSETNRNCHSWSVDHRARCSDHNSSRKSCVQYTFHLKSSAQRHCTDYIGPNQATNQRHHCIDYDLVLLEGILGSYSVVEGGPIKPKEESSQKAEKVRNIADFDICAGFNLCRENETCCEAVVGTVRVNNSTTSRIYHADFLVNDYLVERVANHVYSSYDQDVLRPYSSNQSAKGDKNRGHCIGASYQKNDINVDQEL